MKKVEVIGWEVREGGRESRGLWEEGGAQSSKDARCGAGTNNRSVMMERGVQVLMMNVVVVVVVVVVAWVIQP